jgi:glycosyltransferase involved in cell wall biosynthesis
MRLAFITNLPTHFHARLFETIAKNYDTDFLFFSDASERWVGKRTEQTFGTYKGRYVRGFRLSSRFRINLPLLWILLTRKYDVFIQAINGRFELLATFLVAKFLRRPFVLWTNLWFHPGSWFHRVTFPIVKYIYHHADAVVVYGYHVRDYLVGLNVDERKIFYSWNVVDNDFFNKPVPTEEIERIRQRLGLQDRRVILFVGRHSNEKGLTYLLNAFELVPQELRASLLLIGDGEEKPELIAYAKRNRLERVHFLGFIPNRELPAYYALADIFVLPSITTRTQKEVWGIVMNEAMNQGCPVIATDAVGGAVGGLIDQGRNGVVVQEKNAIALRDAMVSILSDQKKLTEMKEYARMSIRDWDHRKSFRGFHDAIAYVQNIRGNGLQSSSSRENA